MAEAYSLRVSLFERALSRLEEALAGYADLYRRLLDKLKEGESRRLREGG